tara:strand:- start:92 stop:742 length:651 start_codon:yes stop_codon:yes gene_type:complete
MERQRHQQSGLIHIWQPGNGSRYELVCTELKKNVDLFVWVNAPPGVQATTKLARSPSTSDLPASWFLKRMTGMMEADAAAILAFLHEVKHYCTTMPTGFDANGLWSDDRAHLTENEVEKRLDWISSLCCDPIDIGDIHYRAAERAVRNRIGEEKLAECGHEFYLEDCGRPLAREYDTQALACALDVAREWVIWRQAAPDHVYVPVSPPLRESESAS